eukprot:1698254-Rhodomonas_salina.2
MPFLVFDFSGSTGAIDGGPDPISGRGAAVASFPVFFLLFLGAKRGESNGHHADSDGGGGLAVAEADDGAAGRDQVRNAFSCIRFRGLAPTCGVPSEVPRAQVELGYLRGHVGYLAGPSKLPAGTMYLACFCICVAMLRSTAESKPIPRRPGTAQPDDAAKRI